MRICKYFYFCEFSKCSSPNMHKVGLCMFSNSYLFNLSIKFYANFATQDLTINISNRRADIYEWKTLKEAPAISVPILSKLYIITSKFARARPHRCFGICSYILTVKSSPSSCCSLFTQTLRCKRANKTKIIFLIFILKDFLLIHLIDLFLTFNLFPSFLSVPANLVI